MITRTRIQSEVLMGRTDVPNHIKEAAFILQGVLARALEADKLQPAGKPSVDEWEEED